MLRSKKEYQPHTITLTQEEIQYLNDMCKGIVLRRNIKRSLIHSTAKVAGKITNLVAKVVNYPRQLDPEGVVIKEVRDQWASVDTNYNINEEKERIYFDLASKGVLLTEGTAPSTVEDLAGLLVKLGCKTSDVRSAVTMISKTRGQDVFKKENLPTVKTRTLDTENLEFVNVEVG